MFPAPNATSCIASRSPARWHQLCTLLFESSLSKVATQEVFKVARTCVVLSGTCISLTAGKCRRPSGRDLKTPGGSAVLSAV